MSTSQDNDLNLDLVFLPAWAQQPANKNIYAAHPGETDRDERRERRGERRDRPRREGEGRGRGPGRGAPGADRGGERRSGRRPEGPFRGGPRRGDQQQAPRPEPAPLPEVDVQFRPEEQGVDSLARQIKMTGRAYPLFGVAQLILEKPERHNVVLAAKKNAEGNVLQPLFACALDDTLWLSESEAVSYVLDKHFATFYQADRTKTDPPKGVYTFVAQCGMSGAILGPPNYHDYQNQLRKLHAERFSRMPFEAFKARVRIVRDEEVVKKWIEDQSWKTEYVCLNVPEPLKLSTREEVEKHFRETHQAAIIKPVESQQITGVASRGMPCRPLQRLVRVRWEDQKRFPLQLATTLSQQFASRGLQFFKVNKTVTHVSVARPHYLDLETTVVSENVKRIVAFVNEHPKCTRRQLFEALAPSAIATTQAPAEGTPAPELTPEATAIITDLHWLVHQGHVIEFANGTLETAKKPLPRPPKQAKQAAATPEGAAQSEAQQQESQTAESPAEIPGEIPATATVTPEAPVAELAQPATAPESPATEQPASAPANTPAEPQQ